MKRPKWILLVEDDAPIAELATLALAPAKPGCEVIVAHDGPEALECLRHRSTPPAHAEGHPALVLLDLKLPKLDGFEVLRQIKSDSRLRHVPVVIFSSSREPADIRRAYQLGANAYVVKPVDFRQFNLTLERVALFWAAENEGPPEASCFKSGALAPSRFSAAALSAKHTSSSR